MIDEYLADLDPEPRAALQSVREIIAAAAPDAVEGRSYGMPAFLLGGRPLAGFRASKRHLSLFPFSDAVVAALAPRLGGRSLSKGTIRFTAADPPSEAVIREMVRLRRAEIEPA